MCVFIHFAAFETEKGKDTLTIFNGWSGPVIGTWSGSEGPEARIVSTAPDGSIAVSFSSDGGTQLVGWAAHVGVVGRGSTPSIRSAISHLPSEFSVSQVADHIRFAVPSTGRGCTVTMKLFALNGACVWRSDMSSVEPGTHSVELPDALAAGLYVLRMTAGTWIGTTRIMTHY